MGEGHDFQKGFKRTKRKKYIKRLWKRRERENKIGNQRNNGKGNITNPKNLFRIGTVSETHSWVYIT